MEEKFNIALGINEVKTIIMIFVFLIIGIVIVFYIAGLDLIDDESAEENITDIIAKFAVAIAVVVTVVIISVLLLLFKVFKK